MTQRADDESLHVTIVSRNEETLGGLRAYFEQSGVLARASDAIAGASLVEPTTSAVILFPDDYEEADVTTTISALRRAHPRVLLLLVTRETHKRERALAPDGRSRLPLVLPRPSFGWSILDTIRAHAHAPDSPQP